MPAPDRVDNGVPIEHVSAREVRSENRGSGTQNHIQSASLLALVDALIKTRLKAKMWTEKTARQHRSIAELLAKVAGTENPAAMGQSHVGAYVSLLSVIPKNWGKSSRDAARSMDEILARSEELEDDEIGVAPPTHERHLLQLGTILDHVAGQGFVIGTIPASAHVTDAVAPEDKRAAFTTRDGMRLFNNPPWTEGRRDALFWVPLICWYQLTRLSEACGLMLEDVDFDAPALLLRNNPIRRLKNIASHRRLAIPQELLRLGILTYFDGLYIKDFGTDLCLSGTVAQSTTPSPWGPVP